MIKMQQKSAAYELNNREYSLSWALANISNSGAIWCAVSGSKTEGNSLLPTLQKKYFSKT